MRQECYRTENMRGNTLTSTPRRERVSVKCEDVMPRDKDKSLAIWEKYGQNVLMAMPYADAVITEANGAHLRDADGNEILDFSAGQFCSILGHSHPRFIEKLKAQLGLVSHLGTQFVSPIV